MISGFDSSGFVSVLKQLSDMKCMTERKTSNEVLSIFYIRGTRVYCIIRPSYIWDDYRAKYKSSASINWFVKRAQGGKFVRQTFSEVFDSYMISDDAKVELAFNLALFTGVEPV